MDALRKVRTEHKDEDTESTAREYGADIPFVRPDDLSDDLASTAPVIKYAIEWNLKYDFDPTEICCIYATAPFPRSDDIMLGQNFRAFRC